MAVGSKSPELKQDSNKIEIGNDKVTRQPVLSSDPHQHIHKRNIHSVTTQDFAPEENVTMNQRNSRNKDLPNRSGSV